MAGMRLTPPAVNQESLEPVDSPTDPPFLSERDWGKLIRDIHHGQVVPLVGPELITVPDPDGEPVPLRRHLAPLLAASDLIRSNGDPPETVGEVVSAHLLDGGRRADVYDEIRELLDGLREEPPSDTLRRLARITGFDFWIAGTFDHQLSKALEVERVDYEEKRDLLRYHPTAPVDVPEPLGKTRLYHILGDFDTYPDFAVWEEDYMEFVCGLIEGRDTLERLFRLLKKRQLLILGAPASDWIVRFLLRAARQERLSDRPEGGAGEYLADSKHHLEPPMVFFFDKMIKTTRVIDGSPVAFVEELCRQWEKRHGQSESDDAFLARIPDTMPNGAVFISYASEDLPAALRIARALDAVQVPVWLDKARLRAGGNYEAALKAAVRAHCSFFLSLISDSTEADTDRSRFVHQERDWAAERHLDGYVFYIPVSLRPPGSPRPAAEPACFAKIHYHKLPGGEPTRDFVHYIRQLVETHRRSGQPRD